MAIITNRPRMTIRVGHGTLSFSMPDEEDNSIAFVPYVVKSGVSMPANLREAFKSLDFLREAPPRVRLVIDANVMMVPVSQFEESEARILFDHTFPGREQEVLFSSVLPELNAVAVSSVNKDLKLVIDDHFQDVLILPAMTPVWNHLYRRSFTGAHQKLFGYFHERQLDIFSFQQNRFKFSNAFEVKCMHDAVYFLLYVWNSLNMNQQEDELHLVGDVFQGDAVTASEREELLDELRKYLQKVYVINPTADFNQAPVTEISGMPYDLQTLFARKL